MHADDPSQSTWVPGASGSLWDIDNLPYGVFSRESQSSRVGVRIGDFVLDLAATDLGFAPPNVFDFPRLNEFLALGPHAWASVRREVQDALSDDSRRLELERCLYLLSEVTMHLPFEVADFVDFYASIDHASNVGRIFRPSAPPLYPNWRHLPVGYHGRAGSVIPSGMPVMRPQGQIPDSSGNPTFGPSARLDIEAELGFVVGSASQPNHPVTTSRSAEHIFGVVGLNDWSARDIQRWEYVPLGPFLAKSFATSISCWVTPLAALEHATVPLPVQEPEPLPYLRGVNLNGYDIGVEVEINGEVISRPQYRTTYWGPAQMLAHMTINGAALRTGDLFGSGTISGPNRLERGSLLELSWDGAEPWQDRGRDRNYLEDGDEVVLRYSAPGANGRIGLGEVQATILPSRPLG